METYRVASKKKAAKRRSRGPDRKPRKSPGTRKTPKSPGRPKGSRNALPQGATGAIKQLHHRVPGDAPDAARDVADEAFETVVKVMRGTIRKDTQARLTAAKLVREEVCGPIPKAVQHEHEHEHSGGISVVVKTAIPRNPGDEGAEENGNGKTVEDS